MPLSVCVAVCCVLMVLQGVLSAAEKGKARQRQLPFETVELSASNVTNNVEEWESDLAVMFYSPTCQYCKQLSPSWDQISILATQNAQDLTVGRFNCEASEDHLAVCHELSVDRYPSVYFIGYGNYNQAPEGNPFLKNAHPRIARYSADLYPEAIYDWVRMLTAVSRGQRRWDDFKGTFSFFGPRAAGGSGASAAGRSSRDREARKVARLRAELEEAEGLKDLYRAEVEKYKARDVFETIPDSGDPWPLLNELQPDKANLPLRVCVAELGQEYCKYVDAEDEPWCADPATRCAKHYLVPPECRPDTCPFIDPRGCNVVSSCLKPEVIAEYQRILKDGELRI